jgi:hypothetical protein
MPETANARRGVLAIRKYLKKVKCIYRGAGSEIEARTMRVARIIFRKCNADECIALDASTMPCWLTDQHIHLAYAADELEGFEEPAPEPAAPIEDSESLSKVQIRSRAADIYMVDNRERIKIQARHLQTTTHLHSKSRLEQIVRGIGWKEWQALPEATRHEYIGKARAGRERCRGRGGAFAIHGDEPAVPMDHVLLVDVSPNPTTQLKRKYDQAKLGNAFVEVIRETLRSPLKKKRSIMSRRLAHN